MTEKRKRSKKILSPGSKDGRPLHALTEKEWNLIQNACKIQCTGDEVAALVGIEYDLLADIIKRTHGVTFPEYFKKYAAEGRASLRRKQFQSAIEKDNVTMQIWLGKQYLGQTDRLPEDEGDNVAQPINITFMPYDASKPDNPTDNTPG